MMIMNQNTALNVRKVKNGKPNQTKIARRKSARKMVAEKIATLLHQLKKMLVIQTMHRSRKGAVERRRRSNCRRHQAAERQIQVRFDQSFFFFRLIHSQREIAQL